MSCNIQKTGHAYMSSTGGSSEPLSNFNPKTNPGSVAGKSIEVSGNSFEGGAEKTFNEHSSLDNIFTTAPEFGNLNPAFNIPSRTSPPPNFNTDSGDYFKLSNFFSNPTGAIYILPDGSKQIRNLGVTLTERPDGTIIQDPLKYGEPSTIYTPPKGPLLGASPN